MKSAIPVISHNILRPLLGLVLVATFIICPLRIYGEVTVDGTQAQRSKIAKWLTKSVGTKVTIGNDGKISVANGGNKSATRLRNMAKPGTSVTIKIVNDDPNVSVGGWQSSDPANPKKTTTGTQLVDIKDLENFGNVINSYGLTPDSKLMHEITEVYEGKKGNLSYEDAHKKGIEAEKEEMAEHNTSWYGPRYFQLPGKPGWYYMKIKRPDGSYVVAGRKAYVKGEKMKWYKEKVPCDTGKGLISIPDPDPQVHLFSYDFNLAHEITATLDKENSSPTGAAFNAAGNLYVTENLEGQDEIRIFGLEGEQIGTITGDELVDPEGIEIDEKTGDIFVAVKDKVVKYDNEGNFVGAYYVDDYPSFRPTDVAVWRNIPTEDLYGDGSIYDIYVTDRHGGKVYRFNVDKDMNTGKYTDVFGEGFLNSPEGISIDSWWSVWVASTGNHRVYRFAPNGELEPYGDREYFIEDTSRRFYDVEMVDFDGVYVVDETRKKGALLLYSYDGELINTYGEGTLQCPTSLAIKFFADANNLISMDPPGLGEVMDPPGIGVGEGENLPYEDYVKKIESRWDKYTEAKEFEKFKQEDNAAFQEFARKEQEAFRKYVEEVEKKWNKFIGSSQEQWVDYGEDKSVRSVVNFEELDKSVEEPEKQEEKKGQIIVEAVIPADDPDAEAKAKELIASHIERIFSAKNEANKSVLEGQVKTEAGEDVTPENIKEFIKTEILPMAKVGPEPFKGKDGVERIKVTVIIPMVPEHLRIRAEQYLGLTRKYCKQYNEDLPLMMAVIQTESYFNPLAKSHIPAYGLMQLVPKYGGRDAYKYVFKKDTAPEPRFLYVPENNLLLGIAYLRLLRDNYFYGIKDPKKQEYLIIASYNGGMGRVIKRVMKNYNVPEMTPDEVYAALRKEMPDETKDYLAKVSSRKNNYLAWEEETK